MTVCPECKKPIESFAARGIIACPHCGKWWHETAENGKEEKGEDAREEQRLDLPSNEPP